MFFHRAVPTPPPPELGYIKNRTESSATQEAEQYVHVSRVKLAHVGPFTTPDACSMIKVLLDNVLPEDTQK